MSFEWWEFAGIVMGAFGLGSLIQALLAARKIADLEAQALAYRPSACRT